MTDNELYHYGVKGMRWGVRRSEAELARARGRSIPSTKTTDSDEKRETVKKVAVAAGATMTVAAAAALYATNKPAVDSFVKNFRSSAIAKQSVRAAASAANKAKKAEEKAEAASKYVSENKDKIVRSASKLNKYKDYMDKSEVKEALDNLRITRDLHQLSQDDIKRGANYVQAFLAYGTAATAAYNLANSNMVKDAQKKGKKKKQE